MNKKKQIEKEIINNIKKCKLIYSYCLIDGIDVGMITLKKDKKTCRIGLLAVNTEHRGNKIGQKLMIASEKWALDNHCNKVLVETQGNNTIAIEFYKKMNYIIMQKEYIYHLWK